ncbi:MAG: flavin reductase family protein [Leptospira sp.]|nr:flavin reductase family protein [Leptospira sp.]
MDINNQSFKNALSHFASGVTVITYSDSGSFGGLTVSSFSSLSMEPPLILFSINMTSPGLEKIRNSGAFAVNILATDQENLSNRFSKPGTDRNQLIHENGFALRETGSPLLNNCLASLECRTENIFEGGDHSIVAGRVIFSDSNDSLRPLLYYRRNYYRI